MSSHDLTSHWADRGTTTHRGGPVAVPAEHAPLGRLLPYRRAAGDHPAPTPALEDIRRSGWTVDLGDRRRGLGDILLALGLAQAIVDSTPGHHELHYQGPRSDLLRRCSLPLGTAPARDTHTISSTPPDRQRGSVAFAAIPEAPPTWLDPRPDGKVDVHAALPMRYYLEAEQTLGVRLRTTTAPVPTFIGNDHRQAFHVVFVSATSWPGRKDYGLTGFAKIARALADMIEAPWRFTVLCGDERTDDDNIPQKQHVRDVEIEVMANVDAVDCLDVFAAADLVIGNDTGLTHLAALTRRPDGTAPHAIGLYSRHAYTKWTTGAPHHHAVATPFSRMMALSDRCPVRDDIDDTLWGSAADITSIDAAQVVDFALDIADWRRRDDAP